MLNVELFFLQGEKKDRIGNFYAQGLQVQFISPHTPSS